MLTRKLKDLSESTICFSKSVKAQEPPLRPKGLGLGANKIANTEKKGSNNTDDDKDLALIKGAFAKITAGQNKGLYCQVCFHCLFHLFRLSFLCFSCRWKGLMMKQAVS